MLTDAGLCAHHVMNCERVQSELEDLSFMYAFPDDHRYLKLRMDVLCKEQEEVVSEVSSLRVVRGCGDCSRNICSAR